MDGAFAGTAGASPTPGTSIRAAAPPAAAGPWDGHRAEGSGPAPPGVDWPLDPAPTGMAPIEGRQPPTPVAEQDAAGGATANRPASASGPEAPSAGSGPVRPGVSPAGAGSSGSVVTELPVRPRRHASPTGTPAPGPAPVGRPADVGAESNAVVVRPGDCLWLIAARRLGPQASAGEVVTEWPRWYAANRQVIGDDPGLIRPGLVLSEPSDHDPWPPQ